jgi:uncharacterized RDD family membrane protein YckC
MTGLPHPAAATGPQLDNRRVLAGVVDVLLLLPVLLGLVKLCGGMNPTAAALTAAWALFYYFALESGDGRTIGKRLLGIRVVRADGGDAGMREVAIRTALRTVDGLFGYLVGLVVMLATGARRQRLGDLAAGTIIASADAPPTPAASAAPAVDAGAPTLEAAPAPADRAPATAPSPAPPEAPAFHTAPAELAPEPEAEPDAEPEPEAEPALPLEGPGRDEPEAELPVARRPVPHVPAEEEPTSEERPQATSEEESEVTAEEQPEATSTDSGLEIVSAIDMIMAEVRKNEPQQREPSEDDGSTERPG